MPLLLAQSANAYPNAKRTPIIIEKGTTRMHRNRNPCNSFLMVKMGSGMDHGRVRPTTSTTTNGKQLHHIDLDHVRLLIFHTWCRNQTSTFFLKLKKVGMKRTRTRITGLPSRNHIHQTTNVTPPILDFLTRNPKPNSGAPAARRAAMRSPIIIEKGTTRYVCIEMETRATLFLWSK